METLSQQIYSSQSDVRLTKILDVVASAEQCETHELPPLYDAIDPDMLMLILESPGLEEISFQYLDYDISITGEGRVTLTPMEA